MTGSLIVQPTGQDLPSHTRNILLLQDGFEVCFANPPKLGYEFRGETVPGTLYVRKAGPPRFNLHMMRSRGAFWADHLLFRDYLRAHGDVASRYEELKRELMSTMAHDATAYSGAKTEFIRSVLDRAHAEAEMSHSAG